MRLSALILVSAILWFAPYHVAAANTEFITVWQTTNDNESITIPTHNESTYNYSVDWGDSSTSVGQTGDATHSYTDAGTYRVSITGDFPRIYFNGAGDNEKIISIEQWGNIAWSSMESAFAGCINLRYNATDTPDLSSVTSTAEMFRKADFFNGDIGLWDVSQVTDMSGMFSEAAEFNGDISRWNVGQVTDMSSMFDSATFFNQDLNLWDVSQVTDMSGMFLEAEEFNGDISQWEVGQVTDMSNMFLFATEFNSDISRWEVGQVTDMSDMFDSAESFNQNLNNWNVSSVTDMSGMFLLAISFNQNLNNWNVSSVTDMSSMFYDAEEFNGDISQWKVGQVTDMSGMFFSAISFNQNLKLWDVSAVTDMSDMFFGADEFNGDISQWDVGQVANMEEMFFDVTLSTENYDALLVGWSTIDDDELSLRSTVNFNAGSSRYCNRAARNILTGTYSWMITDGSRDTAGNCLIPFVANEIADQDILVGTEFSYTLEDTFSSPSNSSLTYTVNKSPSAQWLNFNAETRIFSGTPSADNIGMTITITVTATDANGNSVKDIFTLTTALNQPPVVEEGLAPQTAIVGKLFEYPIPEGAFNDPDGGLLSYTATGQPGWLNFSTIDNTFSGTPTSTNDIGISTITVTVTDPNSGSLISTFTVTVPNQPPVIEEGLAPQTAIVGNFFEYPIPDGAFSDPDGGSLSYTATGQPGWLNFSTINNTFSGTPSRGDIGISTVTVTATDQFNSSASDTFTITVPNQPPIVAAGLTPQTAMFGKLFEYPIPDGAFSDPDGGSLSYTTTGQPDWLNFSTINNTFSGTPTSTNDIGIRTITVTAADEVGSTTKDTFVITVTVSNQPPVVAEGLTPQTAIVGKLFEYPIPDGAFSDPDGGSLSYTATGQPGWLDFSTINNTFSGTPTSTNDIGIRTITVTAADGVGSTTKDTFVITVTVSNPFITIWQTTAGNESITIPTHSGSIYNYTVDWGDGNTSVGQTEDATHSYTDAGTYRVSITGDFPRIYFNDAGDNEKIISIEQWGNIAWSSMESAFAGCANLGYDAADRPNLSSVTSTAEMFRNADIFNGDIGLWDVSAITDMTGMFDSAASFNRSLNGWDVSQVTNMRNMFLFAVEFNGDISQWNVGKVTNMSGMFVEAAVFNSDISQWNVSQVTNMSDMFLFAVEFNGDISDWNVGKVTDMSGMFDSAESFNQNLSRWDVGQVTNMRNMFYDAAEFNGDISQWDVSQVTDMGNMFANVTLSTENYDALLSGWSTISNLQAGVNFHAGNSQYCNTIAKNVLENTPNNWTIFDGGRSDYCAPFITIWRTTADNESITIPTHSESTYNYSVDWGDNNISDGQTEDATHSYAVAGTYRVSIIGNFPRIYFGGVGDSRNKIISIEQWGNIAWSSMESAFAGCINLRYNNAADPPDLSSVTSTAGMFRDTAVFNGDIGLWDVSAITDMSGMFDNATSFNQNLNDWDVIQVTDMSDMFLLASDFNGDISDWKVGQVTDMSGMFVDAAEFNRDISQWDVSQVTNMSDMFLFAVEFNGDISGWEVGQVTDMSGMFDSAESFNRNLNGWDVSQVTNMRGMFVDAANFNGEISRWDVGRVADMGNMFLNITLSTENYDALLSGWSTIDNDESNLQAGVSFHAGNSQFCNTKAKSALVNIPNDWTITDGGQADNCPRDTEAFITTWRTTSDNESITIPTHSGSIYNYNVDWGDGQFNSAYTRDATHSYAVAGTYTVSITGDFPRIYFDNFGDDRNKIISIEQWGPNAWKSMDSAFEGCVNLRYNAVDLPDLSSVTSTARMFRNAIVFNGDVSLWDVSSITDMNSMFDSARSFNQDLSRWDVSNVADMRGMFVGVKLSNENYDALLAAWSQLSLQANVRLSAGLSQYCNIGPRNILTNPPNNWIINDSAASDESCGRPYVITAVPDLTVTVGTDFSYTFPEGTFGNISTNTLTYTVNTLPKWLSFSSSTRTFFGIPALDDIGVISITVTVTDHLGDTAADTFRLTVPNLPLTVEKELVNQSAVINTTFSYSIDGAFSDPDGGSLSYAATGQPDWLDFSTETRIFSGMPTSTTDIGISIIMVAVTDYFGVISIYNFTLNVVQINTPTTLTMTLENRTAYVGELFMYDIEGFFSDPDGGPLSYQTKGRPGWLSLTNEKFSGTPTSTNDIGISTITITATDQFNSSASDTFTITVPNRPPTAVVELTPQMALVNELFEYPRLGSFSDPDGGLLSYTATGQPDWLNFSTETGIFSGTPTSTNDIGISMIAVTVTDLNGGSLVSNFTLTVPNRPPTVVVELTPQTAMFGKLFEYQILGSFSDPDGGLLSYTATGQPDWLNFSTKTGIFSGTPTSTVHIDINMITVTVTDPNDGSLVNTFTLIVPNRLPTVEARLTSQTATVGKLFEYQIPDNTFSDPDGGSLRYMATGRPSWLNFSTETRTFSGTPTSTVHIGISTITVTVTDLNDGSLVSTFTVTVPNRLPIVEKGLTPQTAMFGKLFEYSILADAFSDPDGGLLSYTATGQPDWLDFPTIDNTFSGTPSNTDHIGISTITVTVTDPNGGSLISTFTLTVPNRLPIAIAGLTSQTATVGKLFEYRIPDDAFSDPDGGSLSYTATGQPRWLDFLTINNTFSGTPGNIDDIGIRTITVTVTDLNGGSLISTFTLTVPNQPPIVAAGLVNQSAVINTPFSYSIDGTFSDPDDGTLRYTATGRPGWLNFSTETRTFSGTPTSTTDIRISTITVTAADHLGAISTDNFTLNVIQANTPTTLTMTLENQTAYVRELFMYDIEGFFSDPDDGPLSYQTKGQPGWLSFTNEKFSGTPGSTNDIGISTITVTATDQFNSSASGTFTVTVPNRLPIATTGLTSQTTTVGKLFEYPIPDGTFSDPDRGLLSYTATGQPDWLNFSPINNTFSGTPTSTNDIGISTITVTVTDLNDGSLVSTFTVTVLNQPPVVVAGLTSQTATVGNLFEYRIPDDAFSDPDIEYGDTLTYTVIEAPETDWLNFSIMNNTFSGTPQTEHAGTTVVITVTATDSGGLSVSDSFDLSVLIDNLILKIKVFLEGAQ